MRAPLSRKPKEEADRIQEDQAALQEAIRRSEEDKRKRAAEQKELDPEAQSRLQADRRARAAGAPVDLTRYGFKR